ncbi:MAG: nucleoside-diphosphate kinase [Acidobacteria bacterium]|nr:nucleoside-diphosphate kinase [Acidobacteriota bacterium]
MLERTLAILKPDTVAAGDAGKILAMIEAAGFRIAGMKMLSLSEKKAGQFYAVHRERPFYGSLVKFMSEGPVIPMVLERENAIPQLRQVMGATDPAKASDGTIRKLHGTSIERNSIHGSDAPDTARFEIGFFFSEYELV